MARDPNLNAENWPAFDPTEPFDIMADQFRREVAELALSANLITVYRDMDAKGQLECFAAGVLTGLVGVMFASVTREGRASVIHYLHECMASSQIYAESILDASPHVDTKTALENGDSR